MSIPIEDCAIPASAAPRFQMTCSNDEGPVGTLFWDNGVMQFKGNAEESAIIFMKQLAEQYRCDLICNDKKYTPAINTNVRLFDLVRFMRSELHEAELITDEEYGWLVGEAPMAKGQGSPSPRRLEDYDRIRERAKEQDTRITELHDALKDCYAICLSRGEKLGLDDKGAVLEHTRKVLGIPETDSV